MKAVETVLHLRRHYPKRMRNMIPVHVWKLVEPYGLTAEKQESASFIEKKEAKKL